MRRRQRLGVALLAMMVWGAGCDKPTGVKEDGVTAEPVASDAQQPVAKPDGQQEPAPKAEQPPTTPQEVIVYNKDNADGLAGVLSRSCDEAALKGEGFAPAGAIASSLSAGAEGLRIGIRHSGGCQTHKYKVCWDGAVAETYPGQTSLDLWHQDNGDTCQMMFEGEIVIKDDALKESYVSIKGSQAKAALYPK